MSTSASSSSSSDKKYFGTVLVSDSKVVDEDVIENIMNRSIDLQLGNICNDLEREKLMPEHNELALKSTEFLKFWFTMNDNERKRTRLFAKSLSSWLASSFFRCPQSENVEELIHDVMSSLLCCGDVDIGSSACRWCWNHFNNIVPRLLTIKSLSLFRSLNEIENNSSGSFGSSLSARILRERLEQAEEGQLSKVLKEFLEASPSFNFSEPIWHECRKKLSSLTESEWKWIESHCHQEQLENMRCFKPKIRNDDMGEEDCLLPEKSSSRIITFSSFALPNRNDNCNKITETEIIVPRTDPNHALDFLKLFCKSRKLSKMVALIDLSQVMSTSFPEYLKIMCFLNSWLEADEVERVLKLSITYLSGLSEKSKKPVNCSKEIKEGNEIYLEDIIPPYLHNKIFHLKMPMSKRRVPASLLYGARKLGISYFNGEATDLEEDTKETRKRKRTQLEESDEIQVMVANVEETARNETELYGFHDDATASSESQEWRSGLLHSTLKTDGRGVCIGVLDSGFDLLQYKFRDLLRSSGEKCKAKSFIESKSQLCEYTDVSGHGTHCLDTVYSLAPGATYRLAKVVENSGGSIKAFLKALKWLYKQRVNIILLSIGTGRYDDEMYKLVLRMQQEGVIFVCAVPNRGEQGVRNIDYPSKFGNVICVGSHNANGRTSAFSSSGPEVNFLAPGEGITKACSFTFHNSNRETRPLPPNFDSQLMEDFGHCKPQSLRRCLSGTSMAAPFVAGLSALLLSYYSKLQDNKRMLTTPQLTEVLIALTQSPGYHDSYRGYGVLCPLSKILHHGDGWLRSLITHSPFTTDDSILYGYEHLFYCESQSDDIEPLRQTLLELNEKNISQEIAPFPAPSCHLRHCRSIAARIHQKAPIQLEESLNCEELRRSLYSCLHLVSSHDFVNQHSENNFKNYLNPDNTKNSEIFVVKPFKNADEDGRKKTFPEWREKEDGKCYVEFRVFPDSKGSHLRFVLQYRTVEESNPKKIVGVLWYTDVHYGHHYLLTKDNYMKPPKDFEDGMPKMTKSVADKGLQYAIKNNLFPFQNVSKIEYIPSSCQLILNKF